MGRGGQRKAFTAGPAAATRSRVKEQPVNVYRRSCPASAKRSGERGKSRWSMQSLPDEAAPIRVAEGQKQAHVPFRAQRWNWQVSTQGILSSPHPQT